MTGPGPLRLLPLLAAVFLLLAPVTARADTEQAERLLSLTRLPEILEIMKEEGLGHAEALETEMFPGNGGPAWAARVSRIYDADRAAEEMRAALAEGIAGADPDALAPVEAFFASDLGQKIAAGEVAARSAFPEEAVASLPDSRRELLDRFITANDLVEANVVGGLNSDFAFYRGLDAGGAFQGEMSEGEMLSEVWAREPEIRANTTEWLYAYLGLAYSDLSDEEFARYVELSETPAGQVFNAALFEGYDDLFVRISYELGLAAAFFLNVEDA